MDPVIVALHWNIITTLLIQYHWKLEETFQVTMISVMSFITEKCKLIGQIILELGLGLIVLFLFFLAVILRTYSIKSVPVKQYIWIN